jgi:hypothetical protein
LVIIRQLERDFARECSEVLGKAMKYEVTADPRSHGVRLTATLITEPKEADMADMAIMGNIKDPFGVPNWTAVDPSTGTYSYTATELMQQQAQMTQIARREGPFGDKKRTPRLPKIPPKPFRQALRDEINEWLKI